MESGKIIGEKTRFDMNNFFYLFFLQREEILLPCNIAENEKPGRVQQSGQSDLASIAFTSIIQQGN